MTFESIHNEIAAILSKGFNVRVGINEVSVTAGTVPDGTFRAGGSGNLVVASGSMPLGSARIIRKAAG